jgi:hypothetical protein
LIEAGNPITSKLYLKLKEILVRKCPFCLLASNINQIHLKKAVNLTFTLTEFFSFAVLQQPYKSNHDISLIHMYIVNIWTS